MAQQPVKIVHVDGTESYLLTNLEPGMWALATDTKRIVAKPLSGPAVLFQDYTALYESLYSSSGSMLIGAAGIAGVTPTGGSLGSSGILQHVLEGIVSSIPSQSAFDDAFVNTSGDTMTGPLVIENDVTAANGFFNGDVVFMSNAQLRASTNAQGYFISGGSGFGANNGSYIALNGNDYGQSGRLDLFAGNGTLGELRFFTGNGLQRMQISKAGNLLVASITDDGTNKIQASGSIAASFSTAGSTASLSVSHTNNSNAASHARLLAQVAGVNAGDPFTAYIITSGTSWATGADNSDLDKFKISRSSTLGTNDALVIDTSNNVTLFGLLTASGGLLIDGGSSGTGRLWKSAVNGLTLRGVTGSTYDWAIESPGGNALIANPTGTQRIYFPHASGVAVTGGSLLVGTTIDDGVNKLQVSGKALFTDTLTAAAAVFDFPDNLGGAFVAKQSTNDYIRINTTNTTEKIILGNTTTNPIIEALSITRLTNLTASTALALDASKNIISVANTGTGNNVLQTSPNIVTPTISGTLTVQNNTNGGDSQLIINNAYTLAGSLDELSSLVFSHGGALGAIVRSGREEDFTTVANRSAFLSFWTRKDGTETEKARITSAGNFLIGTTTENANYQLNVFGNMLAASGRFAAGFDSETSTFVKSTSGDLLALAENILNLHGKNYVSIFTSYPYSVEVTKFESNLVTFNTDTIFNSNVMFNGFSGPTFINPYNISSHISLGWSNSNDAQLFIGGTGTGANAKFSIVGSGDFNRWNIDMSGHVTQRGKLTSVRSGPDDVCFASRTTYDTLDRCSIKTKGLIEWGDGTNQPDTSIYRMSAGIIATGSTLYIETTVDANAIEEGSLITLGGMSVSKNIFAGQRVVAPSFRHLYVSGPSFNGSSTYGAPGLTLVDLGINSDITITLTNATSEIGDTLEFVFDSQSLGTGNYIKVVTSDGSNQYAILFEKDSARFIRNNSGWGLLSQTVTPKYATITANGFSSATTTTMRYSINGKRVTVDIDGVYATSNSTQFSLSSIPAVIRPTNAGVTIPCSVLNNDTTLIYRPGLLKVNTGVTNWELELYNTATNAYSYNGWAASNSKGFPRLCFSYHLGT